MKRAILAATTAFAALAMAPSANASVTITCPGLDAGAGFVGFCGFDEATQTGAFFSSFTAPQAFDDTFNITLSKAYRLSITLTNTLLGPNLSIATSELLSQPGSAFVGAITGSGAANNFLLAAGTYTMHYAGSASGPATYSGTIDVTAIPEPATWAMLLVGFGAVGYSMRRRQNVRVSFA